MPTVYNVVIGDSSTQENGTQGTNWLQFVCGSVAIKLKDKNQVEHTVSHVSFQIKTGEFRVEVTLGKCIINELGDPDDTSKTCWNNFMKFMATASDSGGGDIYLHVYSKLGADSADDQFEWYDSGGTMRDWLQCKLKGFSFTIDPKKQYASGSIQLEECWA